VFASGEVRRIGLAALAGLVALGPRPAIAQDPMPPEFQGDWVAATATCQAPARFRVTESRFTLINGRDSQEYGDLEIASGYFGPEYNGIQQVAIAEFNGDQPFRATFNAGEKKNAVVLEIYTEMQGVTNPTVLAIQAKAKRLSQRFPLNNVVLKKCASPGGAGQGAAAVPARSAQICQDRSICSEIQTMAVAVEDFRITTSGGSRFAAVTLRITNKSAGPLTLGYVQGSGLVTDDRGNRYQVTGPVRGLGEITASTFDPKFTLQPGESGDARMEFTWSGARNQFFGTVFALDLAIRDIVPETAGQYRLGQERTWRWEGLRSRDDNAPQVAAAPAAMPASAAPSARPAITDPCADDGACSFANPVVAQVTQVTVTKASRYQFVKLNIRIRNLGDQPVVLCYTAGSAAASDDRGNRYVIGANGVKGIGICTGRVADPQFALAPDQSREATFEYAVGITRATILGTVWTASFTANELELLPGNQIRTGRELLLSFRDLAAGNRPGGGVAAAPAAGGPATRGEGDACGDTKWCDDAGIFMAQVTRVTPTRAGRYQLLALNVKVTNLLDEPLVLCYLGGSAVGSDDRGNRYVVRNVQGIGTCTGGAADPQFRLGPKDSRSWTIEYYTGIVRTTVIGTEWKADFTLQRLQLLEANQLQRAGDHATSFEGLTGQARGGGLLGEVQKLIRKK
jgi:hypothetical protein